PRPTPFPYTTLFRSMHNIRYHASNPAQKHFATAVRANVNAYFKERGISPKGDARMAIKAVVMLSLYLLPFILLFVLPFSGWMALDRKSTRLNSSHVK